jgi:hypothetical protein
MSSSRVSGDQRGLPNLWDRAFPAFGDLPQLALERANATEQAPVDFSEIVTGRVEHEAARDPDCDADGTAVELDCETLCTHETLLLASGSKRARSTRRS